MCTRLNVEVVEIHVYILKASKTHYIYERLL